MKRFEGSTTHLSSLLSRTGRNHTASASLQRQVFTFRQRSRTCWDITSQDKIFHISGSETLLMVRHLAENRGTRCPVLDLVKVLNPPPADALALGTCGGVPSAVKLAPSVERGNVYAGIDAAAKMAYRQRLRELREDLDEAEMSHDQGRIEKIQDEMACLEHELKKAVGRYGQNRPPQYDERERARLCVLCAIKRIVTKLDEDLPTLSDHFRRTITTGYYCTYEPQPFDFVRIEFA